MGSEYVKRKVKEILAVIDEMDEIGGPEIEEHIEILEKIKIELDTRIQCGLSVLEEGES